MRSWRLGTGGLPLLDGQRRRRLDCGRLEVNQHAGLVAADADGDVVGDQRVELGLLGEPAVDEVATAGAGGRPVGDADDAVDTLAVNDPLADADRVAGELDALADLVLLVLPGPVGPGRGRAVAGRLVLADPGRVVGALGHRVLDLATIEVLLDPRRGRAVEHAIDLGAGLADGLRVGERLAGALRQDAQVGELLRCGWPHGLLRVVGVEHTRASTRRGRERTRQARPEGLPQGREARAWCGGLRPRREA